MLDREWLVELERFVSPCRSCGQQPHFESTIIAWEEDNRFHTTAVWEHRLGCEDCSSFTQPVSEPNQAATEWLKANKPKSNREFEEDLKSVNSAGPGKVDKPKKLKYSNDSKRKCKAKPINPKHKPQHQPCSQPRKTNNIKRK